MLKNIKIELSKKDLLQSDLAKAINVSEKTLSNWINEKHQVPIDKARAISKFFDRSIDYMFEQF